VPYQTTGWSRLEPEGPYTFVDIETGELETKPERPEIVPVEERGQFGLPTTTEQPERKAWTPYQMFEDRKESQERWVQDRWDAEYDRALQAEAIDPARAQEMRVNANEIRRIELQELQGWGNELKIKLQQARENRQLDEKETYFVQEGIVRDAQMPIKPPVIPDIEGYSPDYLLNLQNALSAIERAKLAGQDIRMDVFYRIVGQYPQHSTELKRILLALDPSKARTLMIGGEEISF